jgi:hypothetical protein
MSGDNLTGHRQNHDLACGAAVPIATDTSSELSYTFNLVRSRLNITTPRYFASIQVSIYALLFVVALGAIACSGNEGDGNQTPRVESIQMPTIAPEQEHLIEVGDADYRGCTGLVELGDVARAANSQVVMREDPNRFNLGVPGDADILGILAVCVLEFHSVGTHGEPGTTVTLRSTSFYSDENATSQFARLQVSANIIVLHLEPRAKLATDQFGPNSYLLIANDDRLGAIAAFRVKNTVTQLSTTIADDGSLLLDSDDLQDLAEIVRTNLISGG